MADVSSTLASISSTESGNAPAGATAVGTGLDDNLRMVQALMAGWRDASGWAGLKLTSVSGTNTVVGSVAAQGSITMAPTAYATGQRFQFIPAATNTGAATLNVSSLGAKNIFYDGRALVGGELSTASPVAVEYDGTQFNMMSPIFADRLTEDTSPDASADYVQTYDASATAFKKVKVQNLVASGTGIVKLNSGTVSNAATLDIVMTSYTAYPNKMLVLTSFLPATDLTSLQCRVSTDGGSSYDAGAGTYRYARRSQSSSPGSSDAGGTNNAIVVATTVGNGAGEGCSGTVRMFDTTSARNGQFLTESVSNNGTPDTVIESHAVERLASQDTDAFRVMFSSGNIASGSWTLYGLA